MLWFLQKAALEKRDKELKEWQDKQRDPAAEKLVSTVQSLLSFTFQLYLLSLIPHRLDLQPNKLTIKTEPPHCQNFHILFTMETNNGTYALCPTKWRQNSNRWLSELIVLLLTIELSPVWRKCSSYNKIYSAVSETPFTRYNRLSNRLYNRIDNRLYRVNKHPTGCQPVECLYTRYNRLSNRFDNRFDNRLYRVYKHLPGCQTGLITGLTTGFIV